MNWLKNFFPGFLGILFQDLPYLINRIFRHVDFRVNRIRILEGSSDSMEERKITQAGFEERITKERKYLEPNFEERDSGERNINEPRAEERE